jgi:hypothetical protein
MHAEDILNEPEIKRFLDTNNNAAERVRRAASRLNGSLDKVPALKKLLPSLAEQSINVFFSYKSKDERAARTIVEVLRENAAGKLQITYQADFMQEIAGKSWREKICKSVRSANWFILLLPDPSEELDWCLFETGLFEAQRTSADRLICLHHPDTTVPSPIEGYHHVAATLPEMEKFLNMVFIEDDPIYGLPPINGAIAKRIPELARRMVDAIRIPKSRMNRVVFEPWIEIQIGEPASFEELEHLDSATVLSANKEALDIFGLIECKSTFGELREGIEERNGDDRWRRELVHVIRKIIKGKRFFPVQAVFQSNTGRMYRPVALAIDRAGPSGPVQTYHVTFAEEVTSPDTTAMPDRLALLATLLRFAFRFRWEVLEPFTRGPLSEEDVSRLDISLRRINVDWQSRGAFGQDDIMKLFPEDKAKRVEEMFKTSHRLRNPEGTGELDIAMEKKDGARIPALLSAYLPLNQEFLELAADRFVGMIAEMSSPQTRKTRALAAA